MAAAPRKKQSSNVFERRLILISTIVAAGYLLVVGTWKGEIDYVYLLGLCFLTIGYFARDLTSQDDDDDDPPLPPRNSE